jgi:lipoate-protein ligase A
MAVDETLMHHARATGECVLRVYSWSRPTLSFGRNQLARGMYDAARLSSAGIDCVRRPTGGRAVLHHREVTYAVAAPASGLGSLKESYARINRLVMSALESLGVSATAAAGASRGPHLGPSPCFDQPARGELVVEGKKLVGSAQWRDQDALLQHGSILTDDDQSLIATLLIDSRPADSRPATLSEVMGREPRWNEVAGALHDALAVTEGSVPRALDIDDLPAATLSALHQRFSDEDWTWRR